MRTKHCKCHLSSENKSLRKIPVRSKEIWKMELRLNKVRNPKPRMEVQLKKTKGIRKQVRVK